MNWIIENGKAHYRVHQCGLLIESLRPSKSKKNMIHKPIIEQPAYSMVRRDLFEKEYRRLFSEYK